MFGRNPRMNWADAQQVAYSFLTQQAAYIEREVVKIQYPDIQYPLLIPVDTSAPEWIKQIEYFSVDQVGRADWFNHMAQDVPMADVTRERFLQGIEMAAIGYHYTLEELGNAMLIPGTNLTADRAASAKRAYEEFVDEVALRGDATKGLNGFINHPNVPDVVAEDDGDENGATDSTYWANKTPQQILRDINDAVMGVYLSTQTIEVADTILIPLTAMTPLTLMLPNTTLTVLDWILRNNVLTMTTGRQLTIRAIRGLETAGAGGTGRMILYRRDPQVLKMHIPMPHRFLPVWQRGPLRFDVPGIFRLGGVEIRRPSAVRFIDGIAPAPEVE